MAQAGYLRPVNDPVGADWDDWSCDQDPVVDVPVGTGGEPHE